MPILLTLASAAMLSKFLEDQFLKRRGIDLHIDLTDWAKEIGVPYNTLRAAMNNDSEDPYINRRTFAKLVDYFGYAVLDAMDAPLPLVPKNPLAVAEKRGEYKISVNSADELTKIWNSLPDKEKTNFLRKIKEGK